MSTSSEAQEALTVIANSITVASIDNIKPDNTIIFNCDEYRDGNVNQFDGQVLYVTEEGAEVVYLSGHSSRNDLIPWKDILAKLDKRKPYISLSNAPFKGHFIEFSSS